MAAPENTLDLARHLEEGQVVTADSLDEKPSLSSPTISGSTFASLRYSAPSKAIERVRGWPSWLRPKLPSLSLQKRNPKIHVRKLEDHPLGYPVVGAFIDSDESFMIYRRFGYLHARMLLHKQDELRKLEEELKDMDMRDSQDPAGTKCLKNRAKDDAREAAPGRETRKELFARIEKKALEYGTLLVQAQQLASMNRPTERDHTSVMNYLENERPLMEKDTQFIYEKEDLVTLRAGRENAWLDEFVERMLKMMHCAPIDYIFCSPETKAKTDNPDIHYFTRGRINAFVTLILTAIILVLLVIPIWLLYHLTVTLGTSASNTICIGVLLIATLIFSAVLSLFTKARRHEILAAAAGYCAVLVVFVGNVGGSNAVSPI